MKIVYNPPDGAPIKGFISGGMMLDPHYPDGYAIDGKGTLSNGLVQYSDEIADDILDRYLFLSLKTPEDAKKILERPEPPQFACDFPDCGKSFTIPLALAGHKRSHKGEIADKEPAIDPQLIPVAGGKKVVGLIKGEEVFLEEKETQNGMDTDGVSWYGEGVQKENAGFNRVRKIGEGHFGG